MPSTLAWLDHDPKERERVTRILALFQERRTVDELGLGGVRDALSDLMFPGTSTIQTRLRYFLFVPWMYRHFENGRVSSLDLPRRAREFEIRITTPLLTTTEAGIFGRRAKGDLKRLPSEVYWGGLGAWGIRRFQGSRDQYHRSIDEIRRRRQLQRRDDDGDLQGQTAVITWDPGLPPAPAGFPDEVAIDVTREEALYLRDRIRSSQPGSLLREYVDGLSVAHVELPWLHPHAAQLRREHRVQLHHARLFSDVMYGATILYNVMLAELAEKRDLAEQHGEHLAEWEADIDREEVRHWNLDELWSVAAGTVHNITAPTRTFIARWLQEVLRGRGLSARRSARNLVRLRETTLKGPRSRFVNRRALIENWRDFAGMIRQDYRWTNVRSLINDLHRGLGAIR